MGGGGTGTLRLFFRPNLLCLLLTAAAPARVSHKNAAAYISATFLQRESPELALDPGQVEDASNRADEVIIRHRLVKTE